MFMVRPLMILAWGVHAPFGTRFETRRAFGNAQRLGEGSFQMGVSGRAVAVPMWGFQELVACNLRS